LLSFDVSRNEITNEHRPFTFVDLQIFVAALRAAPLAEDDTNRPPSFPLPLFEPEEVSTPTTVNVRLSDIYYCQEKEK
jgi:hypothetical protein